ncbi:transporter substrate-binding domain-containing protein [Paenalcaligenes niemegkensis]|uniref:transporter substrate-binding domain-containing protein n=1 Tax=Paenalcaligenes niemegkensis TaxID=2895469 RepID=UPI0027E22DEF|nr:transporter substrate-binding domain-containing protein [Paenalcaligenes niemegkensis]MCQ9618294.1 transporter substrate-binding domain-containing protein [Paenalcaligenes niemegkensis]
MDVEVFGVGAGIGIRKDDTERLEKINQAVASIRASGLYDEILGRYSKYGLLAPITD